MNDYLFNYMKHSFILCMIDNSYLTFPSGSTALSTDGAWDDFSGMYMMGGEL